MPKEKNITVSTNDWIRSVELNKLIGDIIEENF